MVNMIGKTPLVAAREGEEEVEKKRKKKNGKAEARAEMVIKIIQKPIEAS